MKNQERRLEAQNHQLMAHKKTLSVLSLTFPTYTCARLPTGPLTSLARRHIFFHIKTVATLASDCLCTTRDLCGTSNVLECMSNVANARIIAVTDRTISPTLCRMCRPTRCDWPGGCRVVVVTQSLWTVSALRSLNWSV